MARKEKTEIEVLLDHRPDLTVCELELSEQYAMCVDEQDNCVCVTVKNGKLVAEVQ